MARLGTAARREQLIALGRELFSTRPYDDISIEDIAFEAGISKGLLYHYFATKRDFYVATIEGIASELCAALDGAGSDVRAAVRGFLDFVRYNPGLYRGLFTAGIGADPEVQAHVRSVRQAAANLLARAAGIDPSAHRLRLAGAVGFVEAATLAWVDGGTESPEELSGLLVEAFASVLRLEG